jgi:hypothetical protein
VTHPFHPLRGRQFRLLDYRQAWGEHRVYFHDETGELRRISATWTDVVGEDPFVMAAAGRSALRVGELLALADMIARLRGEEAWHV